MDIKGSDVQKLFSLMPESLENMATTDEQYSSDDGTLVVLTPLETLYTEAKDKPEELLDINVIVKTVFTTLKDCSKDADKLKNAAKIINELNAEFEKGISCLDVLLNSLPSDNPEDTNIVVDELFTCLQRLDIKNIPNVKSLIETVRIHQLFLNMQRWEKEAYEILEYDAEEYDEENTQKKQVFNTKRETLFRNCDELLEKSPHEFQKMLALKKDFPALFLLSYLRSNYKRELAITSLDHDVLAKKLVDAAVELMGTFYNNEAEGVLNKIGMAFEKADNINKTKEILTPLIIKLIRVHSHNPVDSDDVHIHNMIINLIALVGDVNIVDNNGNTPLHAVFPQEENESYYDIKSNLLNYLLFKQADITAKNNQGQTPLGLAAKYLPDYKAAEIISVILKKQAVSIDTLELALFEVIRRRKPYRSLSESKAFIILDEKLRDFPQWLPQTFLEKHNWFTFDNSEALSIYEAEQNILDITTLFEAMLHFGVPFNTFLGAHIKIGDPASAAIVGALLASRRACYTAEKDLNANVFEYLKQQPLICDYLNNNLDKVMVMLNSKTVIDDHGLFATDHDILKICKIDNNDSPEYLLFTLKILVEHVFSTQFVHAYLVGWLPRDFTKVIEEQVKQQLKSAVFAMIDQDVNIDPIKAYLTEKNSGLNQLLFRSFVNNFLTEIHEREIARRENKLKPEILTAYESLNPSFPSEGIIGVDFEKDAKVSKFSSRPTIVKQ